MFSVELIGLYSWWILRVNTWREQEKQNRERVPWHAWKVRRLMQFLKPLNAQGEQGLLFSWQLLYNLHSVTQICHQWPAEDSWASSSTHLAACQRAHSQTLTENTSPTEWGCKHIETIWHLNNRVCCKASRDKSSNSTKKTELIPFKPFQKELVDDTVWCWGLVWTISTESKEDREQGTHVLRRQTMEQEVISQPGYFQGRTEVLK